MGVDISATTGIGVLLTEDEMERLRERFGRDEDNEYEGWPRDELDDLLGPINRKLDSKLSFGTAGSYYDSEPNQYAIFSRHVTSVDSSFGYTDTADLSELGRVDDRDRQALDEVLWAVGPQDELRISHLGERLKLVSLLLWH